MINKTIKKIDLDREDFAETVMWCNENSATIVDRGDYYEVVAVPLPTGNELRAAEINSELAQLLTFLVSTDYIAVKIAEGAATKKDYADELTKRQEARERINALRAELAEMETAE